MSHTDLLWMDEDDLRFACLQLMAALAVCWQREFEMMGLADEAFHRGADYGHAIATVAGPHESGSRDAPRLVLH